VKIDVRLPPGRVYQGDNMIFDSALQRFVMFGGGELADTWAYDPARNAWTELWPAMSPPGRTQQTTCFDPDNRLVVLHGGSRGKAQLTDTWVFDAGRSSWFEIRADSAPPGGVDRLEYDPGNRCCIGWNAAKREVWTLRLGPAAQQ
jgi:hypothetical protein